MAPRGTPNHDFARPSELVTEDLGEYENHPITQVAVNITNLGDGLSESTEIEKMVFPTGSKGVAIVYFETVSHEFDYAKDGREPITGERKLTHVLRAEGAFFPDPDLVAKVVAQHQARVEKHRDEVKRAKEEAKGIHRLPTPEPGEGDGEQE